MPMPHAYRHAHRDWRAFLDDVQEVTGLTSDNMAYTAIEAVLKTFRCRLTVAEALRFADILPAVPRAIFVSGWDSTAPVVPFAPRAALEAEVRAHRPHHNLTPDTAIEAVARALWRQVRHDDLSAVLATLPEGAADYWTVPGADPADLATRFT
jgi:uncharacterized protein (DUF2267 family)